MVDYWKEVIVLKIEYYDKLCACSVTGEGCISTTEKIIGVILEELGLEADINYSTDAEEAKKKGIPEIPAVVINGELILSGYTPSYKQLRKEIKKAA